MVSAGRPSLQRSTKKEYVFRVPLEARDTCLACPIVGTAMLNFQFTQKGDFQKVTLESFDTKKEQE